MVMAPDRGAGNGGGAPVRTRKVKTPFGEMDLIPDDKYVLSRKTGATSREMGEKTAGPRSSISKAVNPLTGHRMTNTEMGDTFEHLVMGKLKNNPELGGGMRHIVGTAKDKRDRRGPIDIVSKTHAFEVKSLHLHAKDPKASLKPDEIKSKSAATKKLGKKPAILIPVFDDHTGKVAVHAYVGDFKPNQKNRLQVRYNKGSNQLQKVKTGNSIKITEFTVTKAEWTEAQYKAGWLRDKNGNVIDPDRQTKTGSPKRPTSRTVSKSWGTGEDGEDERTERPLDDGDVVIALADDGTPFIAWVNEPGLPPDEPD